MIHPVSGFYGKDELEYVSVSTVIGGTAEIYTLGKLKGLEIWRSKEPNWQEITERGQRRGTIIHGEVEAFFKGGYGVHAEDHATIEEIISYNIPEYMLNLSTLLSDLKDQNTRGRNCSSLCGSTENCSVSQSGKCNLEQMIIEEELFSDIGFAGTPDIRLWFNGKYTIWDWKSVRSYKEDGVGKKKKSVSNYGDAKVQIGAYALGHNLMREKLKLPKIEQGVITIVYDWSEPHVHVMDKKELMEASALFVERFQTYCAITESAFPRPLLSPVNSAF